MLLSKSTVLVTVLTAWWMAKFTIAHSWVEQLTVIAPNGTMVGDPGFPRGNVLRTSPGFSDTAMAFLIPPNGGPANNIDLSQLMCRPEQTTQSQTAGSPRLKAAPGQAIALRYQENGHVTLPQNQPGKPKGSGANFVYFTNDSRPNDKFLQIHRQWTPDGQGGDGRGRLISTQNFDDGQCYQVNGDTISKQRQVSFKHTPDKLQGSDLWCQQDVQIPSDAQPGTTITLYWVWDWPTLAGTPGFPQGKQEIYTTCMDVDIVTSSGPAKAVVKGFVQQDFASAAVSKQFANIANPTAIAAQTIPFSGIASASSSTFASIPAVSTVAGVSGSSISEAASLLSTQTAVNPGPVTVTVHETVTTTESLDPTQTAGLSRTEEATVTRTKFVTVQATATDAVNKRPNQFTVDTTLSLSAPSDTLTVKPVETAFLVRVAGCSTTERAYRLRARHPFYILPSKDQPEPSAGAGC